MYNVVLIGAVPPPINGQSMAFKMLLDGLNEKRDFSVEVINLAVKQKSNGKPTVGRALEYIPIIANVLNKVVFGRKVVYLTIAQSRHGFVRDFFIIWLSHFFKNKIVCHLHGGNYGNFYANESFFMRKIIKLTFKKVDNLLVLGENLKSMFDFEKSLNNKISVVYNGIPQKEIESFQTKKLPVNFEKEPIKILYLSNLTESKGFLDLLEAVNILINKYHMNVECHYCGEFLSNRDNKRVHNSEHGKELFFNYIEEHNLNNNVKYHGTVLGDKKEELLKQSHYFVLPTNYINEGQPISIIEAMAYGNVVLSTNYRAIPDMLIEGVTGQFISYNNPESIASSIYEISCNPEKYESMSKSAMNRYEEYFSYNAHIKSMLPFLKSEGKAHDDI